MSLFSDIYSAPGGAADTPLRDDDPGKSGGGFGLVSSNAGCSLVRVQVESELGPVCCGGPIGRGGNKTCFRKDCAVSSHKLKTRSTVFADDDMVFICSSGGDVIFDKPAVPASRFGDNIERYLGESRSKESWVTLMSTLLSQRVAPAESDVSKLSDRLEARDRSLPLGMTPLKKKPKLEISSPTLEAGFEITLAELIEDLGSTNTIILANLRSQWGFLRQNIDTLRELQQATRETLKSLQGGVKEEFEQQELETTRIQAQMGSRKEDFGTLTLFDAADIAMEDSQRVDEVASDVVQIQAWVQSKGKAWEEKLKAECASSASAAGGDPSAQWESTFMTKLKKDVDPLLKFFLKYSTDPNLPGDKLEHRLNHLDKEILRVSSLANVGGISGATSGTTGGSISSTGTNTAGGTGLWGGMGAGAQQQSNVTQLANQTLAARLSTVESNLQKIQDKSDGGKVEVAGTSFNTRAETKLWMQTNAGGQGMYIYFIDFHALVNIGSMDFGSNTQAMKFAADSIKAGHTSEDEAFVTTSFRMEVPTIFGVDGSNAGGTKDSRVLPGCKTFEEWDSGDGYTGVRHVLAKAVEDARGRLVESAPNNLGGMGLLVALDVIATASQFVKGLSAWISQEFADLVGRGADRGDTWKLLCQSVRKIFHALHTARQAGRSHTSPGDKASSMMWGCLQAYKRMNLFVANGFNSDPDLFYILNKHLQDNAASKKEVVSLKAELEVAMKNIQKLEKRLDGIMTKVGKK